MSRTYESRSPYLGEHVYAVGRGPLKHFRREQVRIGSGPLSHRHLRNEYKGDSRIVDLLYIVYVRLGRSTGPTVAKKREAGTRADGLNKLLDQG